MAGCNSVKKLGDSLRGDEIDLAMFQKVNSTIIESTIPGVLWEIKTHFLHLEVIKINQFESKFQSMSVLVRKKGTKELFILVKGAP